MAQFACALRQVFRTAQLTMVIKGKQNIVFDLTLHKDVTCLFNEFMTIAVFIIQFEKENKRVRGYEFSSGSNWLKQFFYNS